MEKPQIVHLTENTGQLARKFAEIQVGLLGINKKKKDAYQEAFQDAMYNFCYEAYTDSLTPSGNLGSNPWSPRISKKYMGQAENIINKRKGLTEKQREALTKQIKAVINFLTTLYFSSWGTTVKGKVEPEYVDKEGNKKKIDKNFKGGKLVKSAYSPFEFRSDMTDQEKLEVYHFHYKRYYIASLITIAMASIFSIDFSKKQTEVLNENFIPDFKPEYLRPENAGKAIKILSKSRTKEEFIKNVFRKHGVETIAKVAQTPSAIKSVDYSKAKKEAKKIKEEIDPSVNRITVSQLNELLENMFKSGEINVSVKLKRDQNKKPKRYRLVPSDKKIFLLNHGYIMKPEWYDFLNDKPSDFRKAYVSELADDMFQKAFIPSDRWEKISQIYENVIDENISSLLSAIKAYNPTKDTFSKKMVVGFNNEVSELYEKISQAGYNDISAIDKIISEKRNELDERVKKIEGESQPRIKKKVVRFKLTEKNINDSVLSLVMSIADTRLKEKEMTQNFYDVVHNLRNQFNYEGGSSFFSFTVSHILGVVALDYFFDKHVKNKSIRKEDARSFMSHLKETGMLIGTQSNEKAIRTKIIILTGHKPTDADAWDYTSKKLDKNGDPRPVMLPIVYSLLSSGKYGKEAYGKFHKELEREKMYKSYVLDTLGDYSLDEWKDIFKKQLKVVEFPSKKPEIKSNPRVSTRNIKRRKARR